MLIEQETKDKYEGMVFETKNDGKLRVIEYRGHLDVIVKFEDTGYETTTRANQLRKGEVKDRSLPSVYGVGIIGNGITRVCGVETRDHKLWNSMLCRCYDEKLHAYRPTYEKCSVSDNFKYLPYFEEWCHQQIGFDQVGWQLDKDILIKGNVLYSEHTCTFIPQEINKLFTMRESKRGDYPLGVHKVVSVKEQYQAQFWKDSKLQYLGQFDTPEQSFLAYKQQKELRVKEVANKWKEQIDVRVYEALMNWVVEISD